MPCASFRFAGELRDHLPPPDRTRPTLDKPFDTPGSVKDAIESFGVPHPEIECILANGVPVGFHYLLQDGDEIAVSGAGDDGHRPVSTLALREPLDPAAMRFILDVHLGRLAAYLRLLGFDTAYQSCHSDPELARISAEERRILLTRDRGLLMRSTVTYGYWLRHTDSRLQAAEVLRRFRFVAHARPWTRCMACNGKLRPVAKSAALGRIPPRTAELHDEFSECQRCRRVYWQGSHYVRMRNWLADLLET